jgi:anti-sigma regulatory factor (Ser/Thr protein kinase)
VAGDPPLGTGRYAGRVETITVAPETRITLYTDGLVEHRERDLDTGIAQLIATLDHVDVPVEGVPSVLVQSLLPHEPDDDVAILSAVLGREEGPRQVVSVTLDSLPHMVAQARETVDRACVEWGVEDATAFDVKVIVSELVTNAIRHGRPPVQLLVRHEPGRVLIDVSDASGVKPDVRHALPSAANGRGLALIAALAGQWGTRLTGRGKSVWCSVPTQTAPAGS